MGDVTTSMTPFGEEITDDIRASTIVSVGINARGQAGHVQMGYGRGHHTYGVQG